MTPEKIAVAICLQAHMPVFLWGEPGTTKTQSLLAIARALNEPLWTVILSIRGPWEQGGLPAIRPDGGVFLVPPSWAKELAETGHGIVFLDELNVAGPTTQNSALRVVNEGQAGDLPLPERTGFGAAGNPPETNTGAYDLTAAMANRFVHIDWPLDHDGWVQGMKRGWPTPKVPRLDPQWRGAIAAKRGVVGHFIENRGQLLHQKPADPTEAGKAWPSHRTWDHVAILGAAAESAGFGFGSEVGNILTSGCVGVPAGNEFRTWYTTLDLRPAEDYLRDPKGTPLPSRQDQLYATLASVTAAALNAKLSIPDRVRRWYAAWTLLGRVIKAGHKDLTIPSAVSLASVLADADLQIIDKEIGLPQEMVDLEDLLEAAGVHFAAQ